MILTKPLNFHNKFRPCKKFPYQLKKEYEELIFFNIVRLFFSAVLASLLVGTTVPAGTFAEEESGPSTELAAFFAKKSRKPQTPSIASLPASPKEIEDIQYIVNTLADTSAIGLLGKKGELKRRGEQVRPVNILKFLAIMVEDPQMKTALSTIKKSNLKWSNFRDGLEKSFVKGLGKGEVQPYLPNYCHTFKLDQAHVQALIDESKWDKLIDYLTPTHPA